jgi:outer membrane protein assembly factor BamB
VEGGIESLPKDLVTELGAKPVQFGFAASPLVVAGEQGSPGIVVVQGAGTGGLHALDLVDGAVVWSSQAATFSYGSPLLVEIEGAQPVRQLLFPAGNHLFGLDPRDGSTLWPWKLQAEGLTNIPTPLWLGDDLVVISGQGVRGTEGLRLSATEDGVSVESLWPNRDATRQLGRGRGPNLWRRQVSLRPRLAQR